MINAITSYARPAALRPRLLTRPPSHAPRSHESPRMELTEQLRRGRDRWGQAGAAEASRGLAAGGHGGAPPILLRITTELGEPTQAH